MRNRAELYQEAQGLGLIDIDSGLCADTKDELMDLLAEHYRRTQNRKRPLLPQIPLQLARNVKDLSDSALDYILANKQGLWLAEEKLDGVRARLHLGVKENRIDGRHRSNTTYEYGEKTDCLPHLRDLKTPFAGTILDGELVMPCTTIAEGKTATTDLLTTTCAVVNSKPKRAIELQKQFGKCHFVAFDVIQYCGDDFREHSYKERRKRVTDVSWGLLTQSGYSRPSWLRAPKSSQTFTKFYKQIIKDGGEGIMLKHADFSYMGGKRSKGMYKWKKCRDMECFITGFVPGKGEFSGLVGALIVSVMEDGVAREVAAIQPGDLKYRHEISLADGSLGDNVYGKVVEVAYLCKTKNNRLRHAVLKRFRPDKTMYDCEVISG